MSTEAIASTETVDTSKRKRREVKTAANEIAATERKPRAPKGETFKVTASTGILSSIEGLDLDESRARSGNGLKSQLPIDDLNVGQYLLLPADAEKYLKRAAAASTRKHRNEDGSIGRKFEVRELTRFQIEKLDSATCQSLYPGSTSYDDVKGVFALRRVK